MKGIFKNSIALMLLGTGLSMAQGAATPVEQATATEAAVQPAPAEPAAAAEPSMPAEPTAAAPAPAEQPVAVPAEQATAPAEPTAAAPAPAEQPVAVPAEQATAPAEPAAVAPTPAEQPVAAPAEQAAAPAEATPAEPAPVAPQPEPVAAPAPEAVAAPVEATPESAPVMLSGTELSGEIRGFLKADKSPYLVNGSISVAPNTVLVIEPGVTILFAKGSSLNVNQGQLVVAGNASRPVVLRSALDKPSAGDWKGVVITGENNSEFRNVQIQDAENGIIVENGNLKLENSSVEGSSAYGVYARNASLAITGSTFKNNKVAINLSHYAQAEIERSSFDHNDVALLQSSLSKSTISSSKLAENGTGLVNMGNTILKFNNSSVEQNSVGIASTEVLGGDVLENSKNNKSNFSDKAQEILASLPPEPEVAGIERKALDLSDQAPDVFDDSEKQDSTKGGWSILGNAMVGWNYHHVRTRTHHGSTPEVMGKDTVYKGDRYKNYFQVPGFGVNAATYLLMSSSDGKSIEFNMDMTSDSWNHFSPNPVTLRYRDNYNTATVGDFQLLGGDIYMSGLPIFGGEYILSLLTNNADEPLFQVGGFFGEAKRSLVPGNRHPYLYNEYVDDGEAQAQRLAYGGFAKWAPVRRFDGKLGAIYANDEIKDPLLRDGASSKTLTTDPLQESFTMYAEGNWLFFPGDIELNGQIAVGHADTTDAVRQRAINRVFTDAGLNTSSMNLLRSLMQNESRIDWLTAAELEEIFGDNANMDKKQMISTLHELIKKAKKVQKKEESDRDDDRVLGQRWGSRNIALAASLDWNINRTRIHGHAKYIGENFYSAGSPDQLSNTREFGASLEQGISKVWTLGLDYRINVENAAHGSKKNLVGLAEGTHFGITEDDDSDWFDKHELDNDRTRYIQNVGINNTFTVTPRLEFTAGYDMEYRNQYRPVRLRGNYILEDGVYMDKYFTKGKGSKIPVATGNGDTVMVDSTRWMEYMSLANEPYLASEFEERLYRQSLRAGISFKAAKSVFKLNGRWTLRTDASVFHKDSLIDALDLDLADTTWAKLGYYYGGGDYFEQTYPLSISTTLNGLQNLFTVTFREKTYNRNEMEETEISVEDELEIPFKKRFLILTLNGQFRYMLTEWTESGEDYDESESDILGKINLRVNHNKHFYSDWFTGAAVYYRPDYLSNEYKDIYYGININYVF